MRKIETNPVVRRLISAAALVALAVLAGPAIAVNVDRPQVKVGDHWKFAVKEMNASPDRVWVVTSVTPAKIELTENGKPLALTADMNPMVSPRDKHSDAKLLSFPLEVGKKWSYSDDYHVASTPPLHGHLTAEDGAMNTKVAVVGFEKVRVPAGEFDAFKLEANAGFTSSSCGCTGTQKYTYWYAPAAHAIVKWQSRGDGFYDNTTELVEYQLQP
jgi:hypothetical protein